MSHTPISQPCPKELEELAPPNVLEETVGACALCGGVNLEYFTSGYDYEIRTCLNKWDFKRCVNCEHVQLDPRPATAELSVIYPAHYYSYTMSDKLSFIALKGKEVLDRLKLRTILQFLKFPPTTYLDIGCGDGRYLRSIESSNNIARSKIYGLELDEGTVEKLRKEGFEVFYERVETCETIQPESISLATMFHVIEHVADPVAVIAKISNWLAPGGILAIETPNIDALDARLFRKTFWGGYHFPRHWHLFQEKTLSELLQSQGIEPVYVAYQTGHSFWMYSFHHFLRYKLKMHRLSQFFDPMKGLFFLILFTGFDKIRAAFGMKTSSILIVGRKL